MKKEFKPGQTIPKSGLYEVFGPRGGDTGKEITAVKGKIFPPHQKGSVTYEMADPAKHKRSNK